MEHLLSNAITQLTDPAQTISERERELKIENLAAEIGRLIHGSNPEEREDLAQAATALLREEGLRATVPALGKGLITDAGHRPFNPLAAGIGLTLVGAAMALLIPFLGIALGGFGAVAVIWGLILSWTRT